jgi:hypothetical protein
MHSQIIDEILLCDTATSDCNEQDQPAKQPSASCVPPPPAKFQRRQPGASRAAVCQSRPSRDSLEASMIKTIRKNICQAFIVPELCGKDGDRAQEDLWAAVDNSFLQ